MRFINLMRQEVRIVSEDEATPDIVIPSSGVVLTTESNEFTKVHDENAGDIPVTVVNSEVVNMPDPDPNFSYVVSWKVLQAMRARGYNVDDVYCPDAAVRDGNRIVGSRRLIRYRG